MKKLLMILGVLMISIVPISVNAADSAPQIYAVTFHADWCGSCKALDPQVEKARQKADLDNKDVLFVKLDLTDATTRHQSGLMASALNLGEFYKNNDGKTGFVLLVNAETGETIGKITKDMNSGDIEAAIKQHI